MISTFLLRKFSDQLAKQRQMLPWVPVETE